MKLLVTAADSPVGDALRACLAAGHDVAAAATSEPLAADAATDALVTDREVIVHLAAAHLDASLGDDEMVDYATRRTYNLLRAAGDRGVSRVVYVSSLRLLSAYPDHFAVTENWQPDPDPTDAPQLATHLGEMVVKEFARDGLVDGIALRVGFPVQLDSSESAAAAGDGDRNGGRSAAIGIDHLADVVDRAVRAPLRSWHVIHAQSPLPEPRYLMRDAASLLGYPDGQLPTEAPILPGS